MRQVGTMRMQGSGLAAVCAGRGSLAAPVVSQMVLAEVSPSESCRPVCLSELQKCNMCNSLSVTLLVWYKEAPEGGQQAGTCTAGCKAPEAAAGASHVEPLGNPLLQGTDSSSLPSVGVFFLGAGGWLSNKGARPDPRCATQGSASPCTQHKQALAPTAPSSCTALSPWPS